MDYDVVIFWVVMISSATGLVKFAKSARVTGPGWVVVFLLILTVCSLSLLFGRRVFLNVAGGMWLLLVLAPALLSRVYARCMLQQRYSAARHLARIIGLLHPADGWREQPGILRAVEMAQQGETAPAVAALERYDRNNALIGRVIIANLYRITGEWEELIHWDAQHSHPIERDLYLLHIFMRALGETGDLRGLVELYHRRKDQIGKLNVPAFGDTCRLMLFAFCGKRDQAERLFTTGLAVMPASAQQFWLATADLAAGRHESAKRQFEQLLPTADPPTRIAIERRLARLSRAPEALDSFAEGVIADAALEHSHELKFAARPTLFSRRARVTQVLMFLNLLLFIMEVSLGGATNPETLYKLGALVPAAVKAGEIWRLVAASFLHYGLLHLVMNMLALWWLGPFIEMALGSRRFLLVYMVSGIGSMAMVMALSSGRAEGQIVVGASGCIMGLVGATGALMLRGWLDFKAEVARRRLLGLILIVAMQTLFDAMVPQVSMAAHLSGVVVGLAIALLLPDRLRNLEGKEV